MTGPCEHRLVPYTARTDAAVFSRSNAPKHLANETLENGSRWLVYGLYNDPNWNELDVIINPTKEN